MELDLTVVICHHGLHRDLELMTMRISQVATLALSLRPEMSCWNLDPSGHIHLYIISHRIPHAGIQIELTRRPETSQITLWSPSQHVAVLRLCSPYSHVWSAGSLLLRAYAHMSEPDRSGRS